MNREVSKSTTGDGLTHEMLRTLSITFLISAGCCFQLQFTGILHCSLMCVTAAMISIAISLAVRMHFVYHIIDIVSQSLF